MTKVKVLYIIVSFSIHFISFVKKIILFFAHATQKMLRDLTLHLVLFSCKVPIEVRYIIVENYFPFLPNERYPLSKEPLLEMSKKRVINMFRPIIYANHMHNMASEDSYDISAFALKIQKQRVPCNIIEITIGLGHYNMHYSLSNFEKFFVMDGELLDPEYINVVLKQQIDAAEITEENVDEVMRRITYWYRKCILNVIDENELNLFM